MGRSPRGDGAPDAASSLGARRKWEAAQHLRHLRGIYQFRKASVGALQVPDPLGYDLAMDTITLPPELEQFATEAVATGRYRDVSHLVAAGLSLLQRQEHARAAFARSLEEAEAESERDGWLSLDDVLADMDATIAVAERDAT
jgi:putative addiction module CopG family antidote